jgi:hypothetical protein
MVSWLITSGPNPAHAQIDVVIKSLESDPHHDLPDDTEIFIQLTKDEHIFLQTSPVERDISDWSWEVKVNYKM